jgi:hypothetical protein
MINMKKHVNHKLINLTTHTQRQTEREREDETQLSIDSGIYIVTNLPALYSLHQVCQVHVLQHPYTEELHLKGM